MSYPIRDEVVEKIRYSIDLVDIISDYITLQKRGRNFVGLCPFHQEKTPSFTVSQEKQLYYCFGCGSGGNVFTFIMKAENLNFSGAVRFLADKLGISIPEKLSTDAQEKVKSLKEKLYELNRLAADFYHQILCKNSGGKSALNYLYLRGIDDKSIEWFKLGFALDRWDTLLKYGTKQGYSKELLLQSGILLSSRSGRPVDRFRNRIIFPIHDIQGRVVGFGGRLLGEGEPKYLNTPETIIFDKSKCLYNLNLARQAIREKQQAIIVEGYIDVITAHQYGLSNVIASLGTALTEHQAYLLRTQTKEVIISYDADTAGTAATWRGLGVLKKAGCQVKVIQLPEGLDPDDYIHQRGIKQFEEEIAERALSLVDYRLKRIKGKYNIENIEDRLLYIREIIPVLADIDNEIERREYLKCIAEETSLSEEALTIELNKYTKRFCQPAKSRHNNISSKQIELGDRLKISGALAAERELIKLMVVNPDLIESVSQRITPEDFSDSRLACLAKVIFSHWADGENIGPSKLISYFSEEGMHKLITYLTLYDENNRNHHEKILEDCVQKIKMNCLTQQRKEIEQEIASLEKNHFREPEQMKELLKKWWRIKLSENELNHSRERED